jgi:hypothetical protein
LSHPFGPVVWEAYSAFKSSYQKNTQNATVATAIVLYVWSNLTKIKAKSLLVEVLAAIPPPQNIS